MATTINSERGALLTHGELVELTKRTKHKAQARALRKLGIVRFLERADGSLVVSRKLVDRVLGGYDETPRPAAAASVDRASVINLEALRARKARRAARKA